jgi:hypothetical protein
MLRENFSMDKGRREKTANSNQWMQKSVGRVYFKK